MAEPPGAARTPVHAVVGERGKSERVAELAAQDPACLGLVNRRLRELPNLAGLPNGCPCCTGRVALQVVLARLVRAQRPARIYLELPDASHAPQLAAVLDQWPLSQYLVRA